MPPKFVNRCLRASVTLLMVVLAFGLSALVVSAMPDAGGSAEPDPEAAPDALAEQKPLSDPQTKVLTLAQLGELEGLVNRLADDRVIFVGESHDRYEDHLNQLAIIRGLHQRGKPVAIGWSSSSSRFRNNWTPTSPGP